MIRNRVAPRVGRSDVRCGSMLTALDGETGMVCTDPPYYDMFDYASLSNLFLVWLRATLGDIWPETLGPPLAPTDAQIVSNAARCSGDRSVAHDHFESLLCRAFGRIADAQDSRYPVALYYGYQHAERRSPNGSAGTTGTAWEAMLESLIAAGLRITATWPLRTERPEGVKKGTRSLGTSLLFICRPAETDCATRPLTTDAEFRRALRSEFVDGRQAVAAVQHRTAGSRAGRHRSRHEDLHELFGDPGAGWLEARRLRSAGNDQRGSRRVSLRTRRRTRRRLLLGAELVRRVRIRRRTVLGKPSVSPRIVASRLPN